MPDPTGLSLDPSTSATGCVLWQGRRVLARHTVKVQGTHRAGLGDVADLAMVAAVDAWIVGQKKHLAWVALEGVYLRYFEDEDGNRKANPQTLIKLAALQGALRWHLREVVDRVLVLPTAVIDRACGLVYRGEGQRKVAIQAAARFELGLDGAYTEHEADAWAVGVAALGVLLEQQWKEQAG